MNSEIINLEINGTEFEASVEFNFTKGTPGVYHLLPEDCYPSEPDEYEINSLHIIIENYETVDGNESHDVSFLIESLQEDIVEQLEEIRNES